MHSWFIILNVLCKQKISIELLCQNQFSSINVIICVVFKYSLFSPLPSTKHDLKHERSTPENVHKTCVLLNSLCNTFDKYRLVSPNATRIHHQPSHESYSLFVHMQQKAQNADATFLAIFRGAIFDGGLHCLGVGMIGIWNWNTGEWKMFSQ